MQTIWLGKAGEEPVEEEHYKEARTTGTVEPAFPLDEEPEEPIDAQLINSRGRLTEYCQKRDLILPDVNEINPVGARGTFSFVCKFSWGKAGSPPLLILRTCGTAKKKKFAKREAARLMCKRMSDLTNFPVPINNGHNPEDRGYWGPSFPACPRSADESGEVCPPLGYEEFDHSEPLPDLYGYGGGYGGDDGYGGGYNSSSGNGGSSMYLKNKASWGWDGPPRGGRYGHYGPEPPLPKGRRFGNYDGDGVYNPRRGGSWGGGRWGRGRSRGRGRGRGWC